MEKSIRESFRERRRITILKAVVRVLSQTSYEQMTMETVARVAEVTKPTLYAYFANKEVLVMEAVDRQLELATRELDRLDETHSPKETVAAFVTWAIEQRFLDGEALPGSTISHFKRAEPFLYAHAALLTRVEQVLNRARTEGILDPALDSREASQFLLTSIRDFSLRGTDESRDIEAESITFRRLILNALFPHSA